MDAIVGSAGDDTITAPAVVATTGAAQTTINSGDSIDGGAGTDTLTLNITAVNNNSMTGLTIKGVENIVYVGSDFLGSTAYAAALAAKDAAATALTAAQNAKIAADALATSAAAKLATATYVKTNTGATVQAYTDASKATALPTAGSPPASMTLDLYKAAAKAALTNLDGTATTDGTIVARATALETLASATSTAAAAVANNTINASVTPPTGGAIDALNKAAYAYDVAAANVTAIGASSTATASIAANAEATSITIDGVATTVTGLKDTHTVTVAASSAANTLKYAAGATTANLGLTSGSGTFTFADSSTSTKTTTVKTASVSGSVKGSTAAADAGSVPGTVTLVDSLNGGTTDTIETLKLAITSAAKIDAAGLTKMIAIDGSASTGGVEIVGHTVDTQSISTGSGDDTVSFTATTDLSNDKKLTSSLSTGGGKDTITVNVSGAGPSTVNAGEGDDTVTMTSAVALSVVDGGAGKDTVNIPTTAFVASTYKGLVNGLLNFEVLGLSGTAATVASGVESAVGAAATIDASKASQFTEFTFRQVSNVDGAITKVADTQTVNAQADVSASANGYVAKGAVDADTGDTATTTTYAGTLNVVAKGEGLKATTTLAAANTTASDNASINITANANALNLTVSTKGSTTNGVTTYANTAVVLTGDVKTATIAVNNSTNNSKLTTGNATSTLTFAPTDDATGAGAYTNLGNLTSVTLTGTGKVVIDNTDAHATIAGRSGSKLATIDASGLNGTDLTPGTTLGYATAGLELKNGLLAESIKLGSALDKMTFTANSSTYAAMDSITGYKLVADAAGTLLTTKSDNITSAATVVIGTYVAKTSGVSGTLDAALTACGASTTIANFVFQNGGNTYIYQDNGTGGLTDDDVVIELVGLVDLDLLIQDLAA